MRLKILILSQGLSSYTAPTSIHAEFGRFFVKQTASNVEYSSGFGLVSIRFKQSGANQSSFDLTQYVPVTLVIRNLIEPSCRGVVSLAGELNTFGSNNAAWRDHDGAGNDVFQLANVDRRTVR